MSHMATIRALSHKYIDSWWFMDESMQRRTSHWDHKRDEFVGLTWDKFFIHSFLLDEKQFFFWIFLSLWNSFRPIFRRASAILQGLCYCKQICCCYTWKGPYWKPTWRNLSCDCDDGQFDCTRWQKKWVSMKMLAHLLEDVYYNRY